MKLKKVFNFGILDSDSKYISSLNISEDEILRQIEILVEERLYVSTKEAATLENNGIQKLNLESFKSALLDFENSKDFSFVNVVPAAGAASRQFQLLKTIIYNENYKSCSNLDEVYAVTNKLLSSEKSETTKLYEEVKLNLPNFWTGIVEKKYAFISDLRKVLKDKNLDLDELISSKNINVIIKYIIEPCGLNYKNLPKALLKFHSYKDDSNRLALEEHIRLCILTNKNNKFAKIHFIISEEHTDDFLNALLEIKKGDSFSAFCAENKFNLENLIVSHSYQEKNTDTIALDKNTDMVARDEAGNLLFRKSGHGALLSNLNSIEADGMWLQNIDNVLFDNPKITNLSVLYKRLMAGLAVNLKIKRDSLIKELSSNENKDSLISKVVNFLSDGFGIRVEFNSKDNNEVLSALTSILDRPIVIGGYVPLKQGQKGGGPFIIEEELSAVKIYKVNTVEGSELINGQENPIFANAKFFNPVNFFILKTKSDGSHYDLTKCLDHKRYFVSNKTDINGNPIKALEKPGLWNGSISKTLQVSIPIPENLFSAVKTVSGNESFLSPLHQENCLTAFTESDFNNGVANQEIAVFCKDYQS